MSQAPRRSQSDVLTAKYVDGRGGWRIFFVCVLIASVLGLGFRLYFSPERLKSWVTAAVNEQKKRSATPFAFAFDKAELRLADGSIPQFAVVLSGVRISLAPECHPEPSLTVAELRLPFRLRSLFAGKFAVGVVSADKMTIDLDGLKAKCANPADVGAPPAASIPLSVPLPVPPPETAAESDRPAKPWWTQERIRDIGNVIEGIDFTRVEVQFEKRSKHVFLESLSAEIHRDDVGGDSIDLATELRVPPETVYGEKLPAFLIEGSASASRADVKVTARVDEGEIESAAVLVPGPGKSLLIDAAIGVEDLPLSTIIPMMRKFGLAGEKFQPRFLWVDCRAKIKGTFQKLFETSPLYLEDCRIEGDGTKISLPQATRLPDGEWSPFTVKIETLDIGKILAAIDAEGPGGIASQFGRLNGTLTVENPRKADFKGAIQAAKLSFSSERVRAEQDVDRADIQIALSGETFTGRIEDVVLRNGEASGYLKAEFSRDLKDGIIEAKLDRVVFDPVVQNVLMKGDLGPLAGSGIAKIVGGSLSSMSAKVSIEDSAGRDLKFSSAVFEIQAFPRSRAQVAASIPGLQVNQSSKLFRNLEPVFLTHDFATRWVEFQRAQFDLELSEAGPLKWSNSQATLENGQIAVRSEGSMNRDGQVFGRIEADYPKVKGLAWRMSGDTERPLLDDESAALKRLRESVEITDESLGLVQRR